MVKRLLLAAGMVVGGVLAIGAAFGQWAQLLQTFEWAGENPSAVNIIIGVLGVVLLLAIAFSVNETLYTFAGRLLRHHSPFPVVESQQSLQSEQPIATAASRGESAGGEGRGVPAEVLDGAKKWIAGTNARESQYRQSRSDFPLSVACHGSMVLILQVQNNTPSEVACPAIAVIDARRNRDGQLVKTPSTHAGKDSEFRRLILKAKTSSTMFPDATRTFELTLGSNGRLMLAGAPSDDRNAILHIPIGSWTGEWVISLEVECGGLTRPEFIRFRWDGQQVTDERVVTPG